MRHTNKHPPWCPIEPCTCSDAAQRRLRIQRSLPPAELPDWAMFAACQSCGSAALTARLEGRNRVVFCKDCGVETRNPSLTPASKV